MPYLKHLREIERALLIQCSVGVIYTDMNDRQDALGGRSLVVLQTFQRMSFTRSGEVANARESNSCRLFGSLRRGVPIAIPTRGSTLPYRTIGGNPDCV